MQINLRIGIFKISLRKVKYIKYVKVLNPYE